MRRRAFSLLEIVVAIAIIIALLGALFAFLFQLLDSRDRIRGGLERDRALTVFLDRLEQDLMTCLVDPGNGAGVRGDATSLRISSRLVPARRAVRDGAAAALGDVGETSYRYEGSGGGLRASRSTPGESASETSLGGQIEKVRFRYHDGSAWQDSIDTAVTGALPIAVEIAVWFDPVDEEDDDALMEEEAAPFGEESSVFDEAFPMPSTFGDDFEDDLEPLDEDVPPPSRVRVIAIPDAAVPATSFDDTVTP